MDPDLAPDPVGELTPALESPANPFFASLGTNGRTCGSCHHQEAGWSITPAIAQQIAAANPNDPLFHPVDGTDCPLAANSNPSANSTELLRHGTIRVELAIPANAEFFLNGFADPHACATPPSAGRLYLFRRPLPSTNLPFLATVMWDGRETTQATIRDDLLQQAEDATLGHAQGIVPLTIDQKQGIFDFENVLFTAQTTLRSGNSTVDLTAGANGGPAYLANTVGPAFFIGINDTFAPDFDPQAFKIFARWEPSAPQAGLTSLQQSIGRGEAIFNSRRFPITNVDGLNGAEDRSQATITGTCTTCHNNPEVGNHSSSLPINIGISDASGDSAAGRTLDVRSLPIYTFRNRTTGAVKTVTDPGRALITGRWRDIGKMKGPILRGLAGREPLFHNGSGTTVAKVVDFYNLRFAIGLSKAEKTDLTNFLKSL